jgi:AcrR family transcriptional regulator
MSNSQDVKDPIREEIINGAKELFERFGFKKTTMEDIARAIGKSKSALYYYYKTKEDIFEAVVLQEVDEQREQVTEVVKKEESASDKFRMLFISMLEGIKQKANKFSIFRSELHETHFLVESILKQRDSIVEEQLKDILILGISRHEVKMMNNAEMGIWAKTVNLLMRTMGNKIFAEDEFNLSGTQLSFLADTLFCGVAAKK